MPENKIPDHYWRKTKSRYNSHAYFDTIHHHHIFNYGAKKCNVMIVLCRDGQWYIEDTANGGTEGVKDVFNPFDRDSYPTFFSNLEMANIRAAEIVSSITGCKTEHLLLMTENRMPEKYWCKIEERYNSHEYFDTINHHHISDYGDTNCDIMIVECRDGRWFIEDHCGGASTNGTKDVFNPFETGSYPTFFSSLKRANIRAAEIVSSITGCEVEDLLLEA